MTDRYEFDESQNRLIGNLARRMHFVGMCLTVLGLLVLLGSVLRIVGPGRERLAPLHAPGLIQGILLFLTGIWTTRASRSFRLIVDTPGNDIGNLMEALANLRKLYSLQYWLLLIALILIVAALVLGLTHAHRIVP